jgi:type I restriction enzyme S subunit
MNWNKKTLGEIYEIEGGSVQTGPFGSQLHEADYKEFGVPVIMPKDIVDDKLDLSGIARISDDDAKRLSQHIVRRNDVIFPRRGEIGKRILIGEENIGAFCGTGCIRLRGTSLILDPLFLFYFLKQPAVVKWIENQAIGATMMNLNTSILNSIPIKYPTIDIQQKIVSVLSSYDELIENNKQRSKLLEGLAEEIYREWFVRMRFQGYESCTAIDGLPEGWENGTLGELVEFKKGRSITLDTVTNGSVPVVAGGLTPAYFHNEANTQSPTITISASGANAGYVNLYYEDIWASDCSFVDTASTNFIYFFYLTLKIRQTEVTFLQKGSAQPHVYPKDIMALKMAKPDTALIERFTKIVKPFFEEIKTLSRKSLLLKETRDLLLPRLISGKLSVEHSIEETESLSMAAESTVTYESTK